MASLLERTLGGIRKDNAAPDNRRTSGGGGQSRSSPYARPAGDSWKHDKFDTPDSSSSSTREPASRSSTADQGPSNKLVIRNLHYEVSERELELLFVQIGPMASAPKIKFDRSGRSTGTAWVTYLEDKHAAKAKEAFNGAMAKGEPIEVDFDYRNDRPSERGAAAPGSLLARLGATEPAARGPKYAAPTRGPGGGPDRAPRAERGAPRDGPRGGERGDRERGGRGGGRGGRGGRGGERSAGGGRGDKRAPKTNEDLDAELEAFMKAPAGDDKAKSTSAPAPTAGGDDVEMS